MFVLIFFFWRACVRILTRGSRGALIYLNEASTLRAVYERLPADEIKLLAQELPQVLCYYIYIFTSIFTTI